MKNKNTKVTTTPKQELHNLLCLTLKKASVNHRIAIRKIIYIIFLFNHYMLRST